MCFPCGGGELERTTRVKGGPEKAHLLRGELSYYVGCGWGGTLEQKTKQQRYISKAIFITHADMFRPRLHLGTGEGISSSKKYLSCPRSGEVGGP